ncbi:putative Xaa-Pro aminopeptidase P [Linderina pennispora]|uniref:Putative Xaa-Pro aminopeptidase P n=1 Tax=Linderina pennispora TaxID=61395 RepID=A0A1Y1VYV8_9FUNG|nr:putative Xaa-Pro aminopeptidase P [Linderina pennispora]ORX66206.1 putative Xaa-Pro aminopeptidase P [Linderina pennispora]
MRASPASSTTTLAQSFTKKQQYSSVIDATMVETVKTGERLKHLRELMADPKYNVTAYVVPSGDAHQSEYVGTCDERRGFISGFDGSAGCAVVTMDKAAMFTDGRYFLQARQQMDDNWTLMKRGLPGVPTWEEYLTSHLPAGTRVGIDPTLLSAATGNELKAALNKNGSGELVAIPDNLVDIVWGNDRPARSTNKAFVHDIQYSGEARADKVQRVRAELDKLGVDGLVVAALDEIAWLFNLRGNDIAYNPVFFAYALVTKTDVTLFIDDCKLDDSVRQHLQGVMIKPYQAIFGELSAMAASLAADKRKLLAGETASWALVQALGEDSVKVDKSPVTLLKALKNPVELEGMRQSHVRDGAAMANYFGWLEHELVFNGGHLRLSEVDVADKLESLRRAQKDCVGLSFDTISSVGANGAIIHYSPKRGSEALLDINKMYLCDSGGQYLDGTTDVTRTMHFGTPTAWERECFTRVLKGHIALDRAVFPSGTNGYALDPLARLPLWELGLDFRHGTGHGVGSFLNVHEGPQGVGMRDAYLSAGFQHGMTITNEPGYYEDGSFGIRIENTCLVVRTETKFDYSNGQGFLTFEPVTMVPIQKKLIQAGLLTPDEIKWLDAYHDKVWQKVSPLLEEGSLGYEWLKRETSPL